MRARSSAFFALALALLLWLPSPAAAAPFGWENGESRPFSFEVLPSGDGYEFWLAGFGAHTFDTSTDCCMELFEPLMAAHPASSVRFWGLTYNGLHISTEFRDGLDLAYFFNAVDTLHSMSGFVELSWIDYEAQIQTVQFSLADPEQIPEPVTLLLLGGGTAAVLWQRSRRRG